MMIPISPCAFDVRGQDDKTYIVEHKGFYDILIGSDVPANLLSPYDKVYGPFEDRPDAERAINTEFDLAHLRA